MRGEEEGGGYSRGGKTEEGGDLRVDKVCSGS